MKIEKNKVVSMHYTLKNNAGDVLDSSNSREPLAYIQGIGNIISGLEEAMEGKSTGDKVAATIPPEKAYGTRDDKLIFKVDKESVNIGKDIEVGMKLQAENESGVFLVTVTDITDADITLDGNHDLAGETLHFDVEVMEVREATSEELDHGHVHGPGGHNH